jgi:hypothetical protein
MELQYYIQYILSWFYHNVFHTDTTLAIIKIMIIIGLVSLLIYREYVWFALLCIVLLSAECFRYIKEANGDITTIQSMIMSLSSTSVPRIFNRDELTTGVAIHREGFSLAVPKIIQGDDSGNDHRRSNKFIEEDSNDFTEKYFKSKQCSIGTGIGGITMFGSNELIGDTSRTTVLSGIYDFEGKLREIPNRSTSVVATDMKRYEYFRDCVYEPVFRSQMGSGDFRIIKKRMFQDINNQIINIKRCTDRFNIEILFDTSSDITADTSKRVYLSKNEPTSTTSSGGFEFVSLIKGSGTNDSAGKLKSIQPLSMGTIGDNASDKTYSQLLQSINTDKDQIYKNNDALKQRHLTVYSKVYGYRKRIDEILSMMRSQTKNDASLLYTIRVSEPIVQELRTILAYLTIIQRTNDIIEFEMTFPKQTSEKPGIYDGKLNLTPKPNTLAFLPIEGSTVTTIRGANSILNIPVGDDTYNTIDEKRYLYGITYYFL